MIDKIGLCYLTPSNSMLKLKLKLKLRWWRLPLLWMILCLLLHQHLLDYCFCLTTQQGLGLLKLRVSRLGEFNAENREGYSSGAGIGGGGGGGGVVSLNTEQQQHHLDFIQRRLLLLQQAAAADLPAKNQNTSTNGQGSASSSSSSSAVSSHAPPDHGGKNNDSLLPPPPLAAPVTSPSPSQPPMSSRKLGSPSPSPLWSPSPSPSIFLPPIPPHTVSIDHQSPPSPAPDTPSPAQAVSVSVYVSNAPSRAVSAAETSSSSSSKHHKVLVWASVVGGSVFLIVIAVVVFFVCQSSKVATVKPWATGLSGQLQKAFISGVPNLKRSELVTACEDFSNIIGTLTDSIVYKGTLSDGAEIAVLSTLVQSDKQWSKFLETEFRRKVETLSKVNHRNFVNLIGYCQEEKPFTRMMVFEYAPNGTLFEHLHIKEAERLDWQTRLRIITGTAFCLHHMHQLNPPVPHRNLQSSSVYLTEDYAAKLSDFSFWTDPITGPTNSSHHHIRSPSMQLLELAASSTTTDTTTESNVHGFGMILLEIITGRIPYSAAGAGGRSSSSSSSGVVVVVEDWVRNCLALDENEFPKDKMDPTLVTFDPEQVRRLFRVARECVHPDPRARPRMSEVCSRVKDITGIQPDGAAPRVSPLWWAELEILSGDGM